MQQESLVIAHAAKKVSDYTKNHTVVFETSEEETTELLKLFQNKFSPEVLQSLGDDTLLNYLFLTVDGSNDSLCYHLEFNPQLRRAFGSISGGSSFKFGLYQRQEDGQWITGAPKSPQLLTQEEALKLAKNIRDNLVFACEIIKHGEFNTVDDYEKLDDELTSKIGKFASYAWVQKYLHLVFPDYFVGWYATGWLKHILYGLGVVPSEKYYGMNGQLALIKKHTGYMSPQFQDICSTMFGEIRRFYRLGSSDETEHYAEKWRANSIVGIGWKEIGDLINFVKNGVIDKEKVAEALSLHYYGEDKRTASRKAGEIKAFYETSSSSVITVMDGSQLIAFVDTLSPYFYADDEAMAHQKRGAWHSAFADSDRLPVDEGYLTTCYEIKNPDNLLYLYKKYYWQEEQNQDAANDDCLIPVKYYTGLQSPFERNRIIFGAPGTGKSYTLGQESKSLIGATNEDNCERVTFHPDYSYASFVGTYKPVPAKDNNGNDAITYTYVPGPFMRVYVKALRNSRSHDIKPFLLIIEEINRANVAAVFGDVFQLLDRDDKHVSEYPIQASEDVKTFLSKELGGEPSDYAKIRIPDNMFIWATMNSADQGVFPMDTAFKRRWDFTYLGIDDSDEKIRGKYVYLGADMRQKVEWNKLRKAINHFLAKEKINEDKQLGPYFISRSIVAPANGDEIDHDRFVRIFKNKVIMYLFEDAAKQKRPRLFEGCFQNDITRYSEICREFDAKGILIFNHDIQQEAEPEEVMPPSTEETN